MNATQIKMKVEIWSDIVCPSCYIGKRKFEAALSLFSNVSNIEIVWKSFQLAPDMQTAPGKNMHQFLAEHHGIPLEQVISINNQSTNTAKQVGLVYDFDNAIPANSFNAHCLSHLAKHHGMQDKAEEILFRAYFTEGKNIDDIATLIQLGIEIGLDGIEIKNVLESGRYADEVFNDIYESHQLGVKGVPFFMFDRKHAISGAQDSSVFLETIQKSFSEWRKEHTPLALESIEGQSCKIGEVCN